MSEGELSTLGFALKAVCHALNAGMDMQKFVNAVAALQSFHGETEYPLPAWSPVSLEATMDVRYVYRNFDGTACLVIHPDVSAYLEKVE
jgi:hypothetical protein